MIPDHNIGSSVRTPSGGLGVIVAMDGRHAWLRYGDGLHTTWPIHALRDPDEPEEDEE